VRNVGAAHQAGPASTGTALCLGAELLLELALRLAPTGDTAELLIVAASGESSSATDTDVIR
jgi:hypothetical protein